MSSIGLFKSFNGNWPVSCILKGVRLYNRCNMLYYSQSNFVKRYSVVAISAVAMLLSLTLSVRANTVEFDYNNTFSGTSPSGSAPWMTATFSDVSANTVSLTLSGAGLVGTEYVKGWYFNVNNINPGSLSFAEWSQIGTFQAATISQGTDSYKADGSGKYDILFGFATANNNGQRFMSGDAITYIITGTGLDALDFDALCTASAGMGPFYSAAQVCAIPSNGQSGWVNPTGASNDRAVPDIATTILLLGLGLSLLETMRRKLPALQRN
jgi:hypothetical protein